MAKKIKIALPMADDYKARTIDDIKDYFDIEKLFVYFKDGRLMTWLTERHYNKEAAELEKIKKLDAQSDDDDMKIKEALCKLFGQEFKSEELKNIDTDELLSRAAKKKKLLQYTSDQRIIDNIDHVAFEQDELDALAHDDDVHEIYLGVNEFVIPLDVGNKKYIGIVKTGRKAVAVIKSDEPVDFDAKDIVFKDIDFDDKYAEKDSNPEKYLQLANDTDDNFLGGMSLQDIAEIHEDDIDALILKKQRLEELEYVGGKFFINYMDDEYFKMSTELWFKNKEGKLVEVTAKSKPTETKYLSEQAKTDLKANKKAAFEIKVNNAQQEPDNQKQSAHPVEQTQQPKNPYELLGVIKNNLRNEGISFSSSVYFKGDGSKAEKKINEAVEHFLGDFGWKLASGEVPLMVYDTTWFGEVDNGCLFTNMAIYPCDLKNVDIIPYSIIGSYEDIYMNDDELVINQKTINQKDTITMMNLDDDEEVNFIYAARLFWIYFHE